LIDKETFRDLAKSVAQVPEDGQQNSFGQLCVDALELGLGVGLVKFYDWFWINRQLLLVFGGEGRIVGGEKVEEEFLKFLHIQHICEKV